MIVIFVDGINANTVSDDYRCIVQNEFDLITMNRLSDISLNGVTDKLSAALCPNIAAISVQTLSPTKYPIFISTPNPTISPTLSPTKTNQIDIEILIQFKNISNITVEIKDTILSIVAIEGNLERDQINMTVLKHAVIIKAKGDQQQIGNIEQSVKNGDFEREIKGIFNLF